MSTRDSFQNIKTLLNGSVYIMLISHLLVNRLWRNRNVVTFFFFIRMFSTASYIFKCTVIDVGPAGEFFNMVSGVVGSSSGLI